MKKLKKNVEAFNRDVVRNEGYLYTSNAPFSSVVANRRLTDATVAMLGGNAGSVIDIGCGDGTYTNDLKQAVKKVRIAGTDPASKAVALASKKYRDIKFFVSNILDKKTFTGKTGKYDTAVLRGVLHHLNDQPLAIKNSLLLGGSLIIIEPNGNNPVLKLIEKYSKYHVEHEERSFSESQLRFFCVKAGAVVESLQYVGFVPFFCPEVLAKIIFFFQPLLEKIPVINTFLSAQIIIKCSGRKK